MVGRELNVRAVLVGRVAQRADSFAISLELVDARDSSLLWSEQYNRQLNDLLAVQKDISRLVLEKLQLRLSGEEQKRLAQRDTENTEAYRLYLKGRYYWNKRSDEELKQGITYFQQAIDKDPLYALAYSGMADAYFIRAGQDLAPKEAVPLAEAAAQQALKIDDTLAEAHTSLAAIKFWYKWDWTGAEAAFKRAIDLNPGYATARHWYAEYLTVLGRADQSIAEIKRAQELDPLSLPISIDVGVYTYFARRYDEALAQFQKALEMDANSAQAHRYIGLTQERKGNYTEAIAELNKALNLSGGTSSLAALGHAYAISGQQEKARQVLGQLQAQAQQSYVSPYYFAIIHTGLGEKEQAFTWLQKASEQRLDHTLCYLKVEPRFEPLRTDPRFIELLRRVGFTS
jgi:tetratricopeptide (TPR) repeat protein